MAMVAVVMGLRVLIGWTWQDLTLPLCTLLLISPYVYTFPMRESTSNNFLFANDHLTPYSEHRHGSQRTTRNIQECQHTSWNNRTYEEFKIPVLTHAIGLSEQHWGKKIARGQWLQDNSYW